MKWWQSLVRFLSGAFDGVTKGWSRDESSSPQEPPSPPVTPPW